MLEYLQEEQLKIFDKYGKNFKIDGEKVLKREIYSFLLEKLNPYLNIYAFNNYITYYINCIFPGIYIKVKRLYNDFIETVKFTDNFNIYNYYHLTNNLRIEIKNLETNLEKDFLKEKTKLENIFRLNKEKEKKLKEERKREEEKKEMKKKEKEKKKEKLKKKKFNIN